MKNAEKSSGESSEEKKTPYSNDELVELMIRSLKQEREELEGLEGEPKAFEEGEGIYDVVDDKVVET